jgi:carbon-monoxide dehydrogenase large subunit
MTNPTGIGASILRKEDKRFLSGRGTYVSDIERPDMTFGVFVRSPHAHARIKAIDPTAALALPGVAAVLTLATISSATALAAFHAAGVSQERAVFR